MRKKLAIVGGLVVVALAVTVLVCGLMTPAEPPLRVGMTKDEVREATRGMKTEAVVTFRFRAIEEAGRSETDGRRVRSIEPWRHLQGPDAFGNERRVTVYFDRDERLTRWEDEPLPRIRPPLLDKAMKWTGW